MGLLKNDVGRPSNETLKTRRILKGLITVVVMTLVFISGYMLNGNSNNNSVEEENKQVENEPEIKTKSKILLENIGDGYAEFTYNDEKYVLQIKKNKESIFDDDIILNDKTIYTLFIPMSMGEVYLLDDLLVFHIYSGDVRGQSLIFMDFEGNIVKEIGDVIEGNLCLNITTRDDNLNITDEKITVKMTATTHGSTLVYKDKKDVEGCMPYTETIKNKYNITDNTIIEATYEFKYLGNKEFTEMKIVDKTTYKEFIEDENNW